MFKETGSRATRLMAASLLVTLAGGVATSAVNQAAAQSRDIKMAFFASPKHPIWAKLMTPWGNMVEGAGVGLKVIGFPGSQIGGSPPGAFKRVVNGIADAEFVMQGYTE